MAGRVSLTLILFAIVIAPPAARAGQYLTQCQQSAKSQAQACEGAVLNAKSQDISRSSATGASSGTNMNKNSGALMNNIAAQRANLNGAKSQCEQAKSKCVSDCGRAKSQAASDPNGKADAAQIPGVQKNQCETPIDKSLGDLQTADSNLNNNNDQANNTKDSSGGMPPMQPPQSDDKKKDDAKTDQPATKPTANCTGTGAERFSDCNDQYLSKCASDMTGPGCAAFSDRYCNLTSSASAASTSVAGASSSVISAAGSSGLVVDKKGEGLGSGYCQTVNAYRFCQKDGRGACPSCLQMNGAPAADASAMARAAEQCPSDPIFVNAGTSPLKTSPGTTPPGSGTNGSSSGTDRVVGSSGGASGGGLGAAGGSGAGALGGATGAAGGGASSGTHGATSEGRSAASVGSLGASDGGGGGGGFAPASLDGDVTSAPLMPDEIPQLGGDLGVALAPARDVAGSAAPSLFNLGSAAYKSFCTRTRLKACGD